MSGLRRLLEHLDAVCAVANAARTEGGRPSPAGTAIASVWRSWRRGSRRGGRGLARLVPGIRGDEVVACSYAGSFSGVGWRRRASRCLGYAASSYDAWSFVASTAQRRDGVEITGTETESRGSGPRLPCGPPRRSRRAASRGADRVLYLPAATSCLTSTEGGGGRPGLGPARSWIVRPARTMALARLPHGHPLASASSARPVRYAARSRSRSPRP
jgi:hypothetical protein